MSRIKTGRYRVTLDGNDASRGPFHSLDIAKLCARNLASADGKTAIVADTKDGIITVLAEYRGE